MERQLNHRKGQVAIEYILLLLFVFAVTTVIMYSLGLKTAELYRYNHEKSFEEVKSKITWQLGRAEQTENGYNSVFSLPVVYEDNVLSFYVRNLSTFIINNTASDFDEYLFGLSNGSNDVIGSLCYRVDPDRTKYDFLVSKQNNTVTISSCTNCTVSLYDCYTEHYTPPIGVCGGITAWCQRQGLCGACNAWS